MTDFNSGAGPSPFEGSIPTRSRRVLRIAVSLSVVAIAILAAVLPPVFLAMHGLWLELLAFVLKVVALVVLSVFIGVYPKPMMSIPGGA